MHRSVGEFQTWLIATVAEILALPPDDLDVSERLCHYGLDSAKAVTLATVLSAETGRKLLPTLVWDYPTIQSLAGHLAGAAKPPQPVVAAMQNPQAAYDPIAVIGIACRFPKAPNPEAFWRLLAEGRDGMSDIQPDRWDLDAFYDPDPLTPGKTNARRCGLIDKVGGFDPHFFGISPREAGQMDPQQRLMLELAWEAVEDAGIPAESLRESPTGVFVGVIWHDYAHLHQQLSAPITSHTGLGQAFSIVANRVSYVFGWQGPSIAVDTACSSSLVAVHLACHSLRSGECTLAMAGGVNLILSPDTMVTLTKFGGLSPDGCCRAFDARANGFARGEGGGAVLLKRLSAALADGDPIYCVIRGSAVNNDGASNGLSAPNPRAQENVLRQACRNAGVSPSEIQYVEAHGTGTPLGDPIEAQALGRVLGEGRPEDGSLLLGSVKTNIGHLEGAAGIAGLIKVALSIQHRAIPPSLHFEHPNPHIDFQGLRLRVQQGLSRWPGEERPLAGVSSFGWGGTNCHVVVEGFPATDTHLLTLSAPTPEGLRGQALGLLDRARAPSPPPSVATLCYSFSTHSNGHTCRLSAPIHSQAQLVTTLESFLDGRPCHGLRVDLHAEPRRNLVFVVSPQGSQWRGMGRDLLREEPVFRTKLQECDRLFQALAKTSLLAELLADQANAQFGDVSVIQPLLFAMQVSLAALWKSWGILPDAVVGHSLGEIAAAHVAGALSLEDSMRVIYHYSRLQALSSNQGAMALVELPPEELEEWLSASPGGLCVAGLNSPTATVISGDPQSLEKALAAIASRGAFCATIQVNVAAHHPQIDRIREELTTCLAEIRPSPLAIPMVSTLTGQFVVEGQLQGDYWARNLRQPVRFAQAVSALLDRGHNLFIELSPHPILLRAVEQTATHYKQAASTLPSLRRGESAYASLLEAIGAVYVSGKPVRWDRLAVAPEVNPEFGPRIASEGQLAPPEAEVFTICARSPEALQASAQDTAEWLAQRPGVSLEDLCHTATVRRAHFEYRMAGVIRTGDELREKLQAWARGESGTATGAARRKAPPPALAFVFCGQGPQRMGMGLELFRSEPVFRETLERCDRLLRPLAGWSLKEQISADPARSRLYDTVVAQPAIFALQMALVALYRSWGIEPEGVIGHSLGELAAACVAGVLTLEEGIRVVFHRGCLMQEAAGQGKMATVEMPLAEAERLVERYRDKLWIAAINSPTSIVLSGDAAALDQVETDLRRQQVPCKFLPVNYAFHSGEMQPLQHRLTHALRGLETLPPRIPIASTVTGDLGRLGDFDVTYWGRNMREPVRFAAALAALIQGGCTQFLEIGPHPVLAMPISQCLASQQREGLVLASLRRGLSERASLLNSLASLYTAGRQLNWRALYPTGHLLRLPGYPFQRRKYWITAGPQANPPRRAGESTRAEAQAEDRVPAPVSIAGGPDLSQPLPQRPGGKSSLLYELSWQPIGLRHSAHPLSGDSRGSWIIFSDRSGFGDALARRLASRGEFCVSASPGEAFRAKSVGRYELNPLIRGDFERFFQELEKFAPSLPRHVLYLGGLDSAPSVSADPGEASERAVRWCAGALHVVQALPKRGSASPSKVWLVTRGSEPANGIPPDPWSAPLGGLAKGIALEHPSLWGGHIDLDPAAPPEEAVEALWAEILEPIEDHVAFRGGMRYAPRLVPMEDTGRNGTASLIRPDGTYLITGGTGSLGLSVAQWLAEKGARWIVFSSRTARGEDGGTATPGNSRRPEVMRALQGLGVNVVLASADVADPGQMQGLFREMRANLPPLRGIVHAAGVLSRCPLSELGAEDFVAMFRSKVMGAWTLHSLAAGSDLDFFVGFSSLSSLWGSQELAHYSAANAFLDSLSRHRKSLGLPGLSINWGAWRGGGMASEREVEEGARVGIQPLTRPEALACLERLLGSSVPQAVAVRANWEVFRPIYESRGRRRLLERIDTAHNFPKSPARRTKLLEKMAELPHGPRLDLLQKYLRDQVAAILGDDRSESLDPDQGFFEMGMDSMMAVDLKRRLELDLGCTLPRTVAFEYPNVNALSQLLAGELGRDGSVSSLSAPPVGLEPRASSEFDPFEGISDREAEMLLSEKLRALEKEL